MLIKTRGFGEIDIEPEKVMRFSRGIPGFERLRNFIVLSEGEDEPSFFWLQSTEDKDVSLVMVDIAGMVEDYNPLADKDELESELGRYVPEDFLIYNVANIQGSVRDMTVNLRAPIVINTRARKGMQIICENGEYDVRHKLFNR